MAPLLIDLGFNSVSMHAMTGQVLIRINRMAARLCALARARHRECLRSLSRDLNFRMGPPELD
jgi:hypothetical protein